MYADQPCTKLIEPHLTTLHCSKNAEGILGCSFQLGKLIPHWGKTAQLGKTCYSQKIMHHVFGIFNAPNGSRTVYISKVIASRDKDGYLECSFFAYYISSKLPAFV